MLVLDQGIIAQLPGRYLATPSLTVGGGEIVCFATVRERLFVGEAAMARCYIGAWRRDEDRASWAAEEMAWIGKADDDGHWYAQPMASELSEGRIVLTTQRIRVPGDQYPSRFNPETGGLAPTEVVWMVSEDGGRNWTPPRVPSFRESSESDVNCNLLELENGDWFWPCERWKTWDDPSSLRIRGFGLLSRDRGESWEKVADFPSSYDDDQIYSHTKYATKTDGRICALQWTTSPAMKRDFDLHYVEAQPTANSWSEPRPTGIPGQNSWVLDLGEGAMVATVAVGENEVLEPGVYAFFSRDDGCTWNHDEAVVLWVGCEREREQFRKDSDSMFKVAFGQVAIVQEIGGGIVCAWRCFDGEETCLRYARLRRP